MVPGTVVPNNRAPSAADVRYWDSFAVHNRFYGAQVGLSSEAHFGSFFVEATGKVGLGFVSQEAQVSGATALRTLDGTTTAYEGGVLAQPGASGTYTRGSFAGAFETSLRAGYEFTPHLRGLIGFDFLYLTQSARAGSLIGSVDSSQVPQLGTMVPPAAAGRPIIHETGGFWAEGLTCGLEFRY